MNIKLTKKALKDMETIQEYLSDYPKAFFKLLERFNVSLKLIKNNPEIGKKGRRIDTREYYVSQTYYTLIYRIKSSSQIDVLTVLHTSRKY
jgi:toxin ParE1/3/4